MNDSEKYKSIQISHPQFDPKVYLSKKGESFYIDGEYTVMHEDLKELGSVILSCEKREESLCVYIEDIRLAPVQYEKRLKKGFSIYVVIGELCKNSGYIFYSAKQDPNATSVWEQLRKSGLAKKEGTTYYYIGF